MHPALLAAMTYPTYRFFSILQTPVKQPTTRHDRQPSEIACMKPTATPRELHVLRLGQCILVLRQEAHVVEGLWPHGEHVEVDTLKK